MYMRVFTIFYRCPRWFLRSFISQSDRPKGIAPKESPPTFYISALLTPNTNSLISKSDRRIFPQEA